MMWAWSFGLAAALASSPPPASAPLPGAPQPAAPAQQQLIVHSTDKKCGVYRPGDEFAMCERPAGWTVMKPVPTLLIETPRGTCRIRPAPQDSHDPKTIRECARQLKLKPVTEVTALPYPAVSRNRRDREGRPLPPQKCTPRIDGFGLSISEQRGEVSFVVGFHLAGSEDECRLTGDWQRYYGRTKEVVMNALGRCDDFRIEDAEACCAKLGMSFVTPPRGPCRRSR